MDKVGIIPFKVDGKKLKVLFITSKTRGRWVLPKGNMEKGEKRVETCHREGFEESGVKGKVLEAFPITVVVGRQTDDGIEHSPVTYYPFVVTDLKKNFPEKDSRKRRWVFVNDALKIAYREDFGLLVSIIKDLKPWLIEAAEETDQLSS